MIEMRNLIIGDNVKITLDSFDGLLLKNTGVYKGKNDKFNGMGNVEIDGQIFNIPLGNLTLMNNTTLDELIEAMEESEEFKNNVEKLLRGYQAYKKVYLK